MSKESLQKGRAVFESRGIDGREYRIELLKEQAAKLWAQMDEIIVSPGTNMECERLVHFAKKELESAVMWAVKAHSRSQ